MQLILTHLFRPKWQHPRPEVRKKAIGNLNPDQDNDQSILQQVACQDSDIEIRCQALQKLLNVELLTDIATNDTSSQARQAAGQRLCELICGSVGAGLPMAQRLKLLDRLEQTATLLQITLEGDCFEIRQEALLRISDQDALTQVVNETDNRQLRQLAAEGITDSEHLQQLIRTIRQRDKNVYRLLKNRLDQQRADAAEAAAWQQTQEQLCSALEKLAEEAVVAHYGAKLQALRNQWQGLPQTPAASFVTRFDNAAAQCQLKADRYAEEMAAREKVAAAQTEQTRLQQQLQQLQQNLHQPAAEFDLTSCATQLEQLHRRWQELDAIAPGGSAKNNSFNAAIAQSQQTVMAWLRWQEIVPTLADINERSELDTLEQQLAWPEQLPEPAPLAKLRRQCRAANQPAQPSQPNARQQARAQQQQANQEQLEQLLQALDQGSLQRVGELIRPLRDNQSSFSANQRSTFKQLHSRWLELQDWQKFATQPKLEQLCDAMEALSANTELNETQAAEQLQALQQQWKQLDSPNIPNTLRQRFQQANDRAYEQCRGYFERLRQLRESNLQQRERLCDQLDALLTDTDWNQPDLRALLTSNRQLRSDWRKFSPVERAQGKKLQKRFNRALKTLESQVQVAQAHNESAKQALVEQAMALSQQTDTQQAAQTARALQKQWKQIGPAGKEQEAALWPQFRNACDQLFAKLKSERADIESQARAAAQQLCEQLEGAEALLADSTTRLRQRFEESVSELQDSRRLQQRFDHALSRYQLKFHPNDPHWSTLQQIESLCQQLEKPLLDQAQVDSELLSTAQELGSRLSGELAAAVQQRLDMLQQLLENSTALDQVIEHSNDALRLLCVRLEILRNTPSPAEDQALRMEYQMARLQDALQQDSSQAPCIDALLELQQQRLLVPFNSFFDELNERFTQLAELPCQHKEA